ncbi:hypothetical protein [Natrarchaeobius oligotrophus]|uniref:Uncharacterized protein n=1 Tax=Natrarchaeobius chitinivorans TaxID=1679083 RepID=A0A3N6N3A9_NATCH|nr:hypothetical protein [Natrarchaeobius chitinivorans]RQH03402.1 hypothetical protein EA472_02230 [Natrarchaeobius chitinivorans]
MHSAQAVLDRRADGTPFEELARAFREYDRWTGDDPRLLVAEAAVATTGRRFVDGIVPAVSRFRDAFVRTGRLATLSDLAALEPDHQDLVDAVGTGRARHVLCATATVLSERPEADDLEALRGWAAEADQYAHDEDPIGSIAGVGPSSFQYLRQLAGIDAARPDPTLARFVDAVDAELESAALSTATGRRTIVSCEWLSLVSTYTPLEIDRIAWWVRTDEEERRAVLDVR